MDALINPEGAAPVSLQFEHLGAAKSHALPSFPFSRSNGPVRVGVVASETCVQSVRRELAEDNRMEPVFWAGTLRQGRGLRAREMIDVLLVELHLEDGDGLELVLHLKQDHPAAKAIVMTRFDDEEAALRGFKAGAAGWLVLHNGYARLVTSILNVANGGFCLTPSLARRLMRCPEGLGARVMIPVPGTLQLLTDRERQVLEEVALGLSVKEIARRLTISGGTVNAHVKNMYRKLQVHSRVQLVRMASQAGVF